MKRGIALGIVVALAISPLSASASVSLDCSATTMTSAIEGTVQDALGQPLAGMAVELYTTNSVHPQPDRATTGTDGRYRICVGQVSGTGHNTYDVHVRDATPRPLYAGANQPYTTFTNVAGRADFTPASKIPLRYMLSLEISPAAISTASGPRTVTWTIRSKAPATTPMRLTLGHSSTEVTVPWTAEEGGGPDDGGWNLWRHAEPFGSNSNEALWWASARGFSGTTQVTEMDRQPYVIDNTAPLFGLAGSGPGQCGPGVYANALSPASPPGTTNPQPIVVHGACDHWSNGARSGLDAFSLSGVLCRNAQLSVGCTPIDPVLNVNNIIWWPRAPLALGDYYLGWTLADLAGNVSTTPQGYLLRITSSGGQKPAISGLTPANLGSGNTLGIVVGSSLTTPTSYPTIGFKATDADGQLDLVPGSLRVRVFYPDESTLVYDYDPAMQPNAYDPVTRRGGGSFDLSTGAFRATGYPLQGKQPGRYLASASITDHGGNTATQTWHWLLLGAL